MSTPDGQTITVDHLFKTYPNGTKAVADVSLTVQPGEVFGLIGPNGAGKTTLLKLISGLLSPDEGRIHCNGEDLSGQPRKAARVVGLMPDPLGVYTDVSAAEYLEFYARVLEIPDTEIPARIAKVVRQLELEAWLGEEVETLSAGWQRRLALGRLLLSGAPVLLLDEPAAGLDVTARSDLLNLVRSLAGEKRSIIVSSHILPELQQLGDRFGILVDGEWAEVTPGQPFFTRNELEAGLGGVQWHLRCSDPKTAAKAVRSTGAEITEEATDAVLFTATDRSAASAALAAVLQRNVTVYEYNARQFQLNEFVLDTLTKGHDTP